jgi:hypothetical protein
MNDRYDMESIVTIVSYEEFVDLMHRTGNDPITTMELIESIADINSLMVQASKIYGEG